MTKEQACIQDFSQGGADMYARYVYVWISRDEISLKREKSKERSVSVLDISS